MRNDQEEAILRGRALAYLREQMDISQEQAAQRAGFRSYQAWQRYEAGGAGIFKPATMRKLLNAIGATQEAFEMVLANMRSPDPVPPRPFAGFADRERRTYEVMIEGHGRAGEPTPVWDDLAGPARFRDMSWLFDEDTRYMEVHGESETGYVEPGMTVAYSLRIWPRKGDGCVVELHSGERFIKEYVGSDPTHIIVSQRFPTETLRFRRADVKGVYKIRARLD